MGGLFWRQETHNTRFAKKYLSAASKSVGAPKNKNCESFLCVFLPQLSLTFYSLRECFLNFHLWRSFCDFCGISQESH